MLLGRSSDGREEEYLQLYWSSCSKQICSNVCVNTDLHVNIVKLRRNGKLNIFFGTKTIICQDFRLVLTAATKCFVFLTNNLSRKIVPQTEGRVLSSFQLRNHCRSNMRQDPDAEGINIPALSVLSLALNWNPEAPPYYLLYADEWVGDQEAEQVKRN